MHVGSQLKRVEMACEIIDREIGIERSVDADVFLQADIRKHEFLRYDEYVIEEIHFPLPGIESLVAYHSALRTE